METLLEDDAAVLHTQEGMKHFATIYSLRLLTALLVLQGCSQEFLLKKLEVPAPSQKENVDQEEESLPGFAVQTFNVNVSTPKIDILFVIDNSGSMSNEIATVRSSIGSFLAGFDARGFDYHLGVISTDGDSGIASPATVFDVRETPTAAGFPFRLTAAYAGFQTNLPDFGIGSLLNAPGSERILRSSQKSGIKDPIVVDQFAATMNAFTITGSGAEDILGATMMALSPYRIESGKYNSGFLRSDARLSIVGVSDEDSSKWYPKSLPSAPHLDPVGLAPAGYISQFPVYEAARINQFEQQLRSLKDPSRLDLVRFDAVVGVGSANCEAQNSVTYPKVVERMSGGNPARGRVIDICTRDSAGQVNFGPALGVLGDDLSKQVERVFQLEHLPNDFTNLKVFINENEILPISATQPEGYRYVPSSQEPTQTNAAPGRIEIVGMGLEELEKFTVRITYGYDE